MLKVKSQRLKVSEQGITLVETLVGLTVLSIGIGGAAALAAASINAASNTHHQLVATGLGREAQEAVRSMRDTNWLKSSAIESNCWNFVTSTNTAQCYADWQKNTGGRIYDFDPPGGSAAYVLDFDPGNATGKYWDLRAPSGVPATQYRMFTQSGANSLIFKQGSGVETTPYYRKIVLTEEAASSPYNQNTGPRLKVTVQVWWIDKGCGASNDWPGAGRCSLELVSYLTNWKNY